MKLSERSGPVLTGRMTAQALRESLRAELAVTGHITLDFEGVRAVSPSFADEIFVRLVSDVGENDVTSTNLSGHLERVVTTVRRRA